MNKHRDKTLKMNSELDLGCPHCSNAFTTSKRAPMTLLCGHTYCRLCITDATLDNYVACLLGCNKRTSTRNINKNYQLTQLLEKYSLLDEEPADEEKEHENRSKQVDSSKVAAKVESEEDENICTITAPLNDLTEELRSCLDDMASVVKDTPANQASTLCGPMEVLFSNLDEAAHHPITGFLRRKLDRTDEDRQLREMIRSVTQEFNTGPQFTNLVDGYDGVLSKERLRILMAHYRMTFGDELGLSLEASNRMMELAHVIDNRDHEEPNSDGEFDGSSDLDGISNRNNSEYTSTGREVGSSMGGSEFGSYATLSDLGHPTDVEEGEWEDFNTI